MYIKKINFHQQNYLIIEASLYAFVIWLSYKNSNKNTFTTIGSWYRKILTGPKRKHFVSSSYIIPVRIWPLSSSSCSIVHVHKLNLEEKMKTNFTKKHA